MGGDAAEDARLVERVLSGRPEAFDALARRYQRRVFAVAYRLLSHREDAHEVAQDALLRAYQHLDRLADPGRFGPWLLRIVTNLSLNYRRSRKARGGPTGNPWAGMGRFDEAVETTQRLRTPSGVELSGKDGTRSGTGAGRYNTEELRAAVAAAMDGLPEKQRFCLVLSGIEGIPQKEVAGMLDCSVELVKWNVFQARKSLRESLGQYLPRRMNPAARGRDAAT